MLNINRQFEAFLDEIDVITILVPLAMEKEHKLFSIELANKSESLEIKEKVNLGHQMKYICKLSIDICFGQTYSIFDEIGNKTDLQIGSVIRSPDFDQLHSYEGNDLGASYCNDKTLFKLWAPSATAVKLRLYNLDKTIHGTYVMERCDKGTWSLSLEGDWKGFYYTFLACVNLVWREAVDPYAIGVSINGEFGVVIDKTKINIPPVKPFPLENKTDAVIYEAHVRDFSIHMNSGMINKGKYNAWIEMDTNNENGDSTGVAYLQELGVTHVELLPINDFEEVDEYNPLNAYNWGYNPLHFFAPDGSYSLSPKDPYKRLIEVKSLIQSLHKCDLRVILDVVYNHVYSKEESSFEKLVPGYYFRYDANGIPSNGTGVGNDLASERKMVRKFIIDCVVYWLKEFDVDGFRFDLMGIMDIDTMVEVQEKVFSIKPEAILLGEGWDLNTPIPLEKKAINQNANQLPMIGFFNDQFRDVVKGSTFSIHDRGFVYHNLDKLDQMKQLISGSPSLFSEPHQSINYVESHDNHTMWDRFLLCTPDEIDEGRRARHRLATSIVILSQGIPFIHAGQEFFRTKSNVENSYNAPDEINALDWNRRSLYKENIDYLRGLLKLRKLHAAFRLPNRDLISKHLVVMNDHSQLLAYQLQKVDMFGPWETIYVIHNTQEEQQITLSLSDENWKMIVSPDKINLEDPIETKKEVTIDKIGTYILCKNKDY